MQSTIDYDLIKITINNQRFYEFDLTVCRQLRKD